MELNITIEKANRILDILNLADYKVVDIYEDSFRALRVNEWIESELNVSLISDPDEITRSNYYYHCTYVVHVLKRYK